MAEVNGESLIPMLDGGLRLEEVDVVLFIGLNPPARHQMHYAPSQYCP